jgi:uncharacterized protein DUF4382
MISRRWFAPLFCLLVAIAFFPACSGSHDDSDSGSGNVHIVMTAAAPPALASTSVSAVGVPGAALATEGDDGDGDDQGEDGDDQGEDDVLSRLAHVNVTISSIVARNLDGALVDLVTDLPRTVDLIALMDGKQVTLPAGTLPPGMYDQIIVVIRSVEFVFDDGTSKVLTPPGGGWTRIIPVEVFEVVDGQDITIELRFNPVRAFGEHDGEFEFSPDFECHRQG